MACECSGSSLSAASPGASTCEKEQEAVWWQWGRMPALLKQQHLPLQCAQGWKLVDGPDHDLGMTVQRIRAQRHLPVGLSTGELQGQRFPKQVRCQQQNPYRS